MTIKIQRLFHGFASIRDYQMRQAITDHEDILIAMGDQSMRIPWADLSKGRMNARVFESKHEKGLTYRLIDYTWSPSNNQETLV